MSTPRLDSIPTTKRGRPRTTRKAAADILGPAIVDALAKADLYVVSGALLRELSLIVGDAAPQPPSLVTTEHEETQGLPNQSE
jgi:hypothetical protein